MWTEAARQAAEAARAAHQQGVEQATTPMQRRQYETIADAIHSFGGQHPEAVPELASHFANALKGSNPQFNAGKFRSAAVTGNMGKTKHAAAGMQRRHFEAVANAVSSFGHAHPGVHADLASHFATRLKDSNPRFDSGRFMKAASK